MRLNWTFALASLAVLGGCATAHGMGHGMMNHEEMMRHCQAMQEHHGDAAHHPDHDPARHGGMSHEEMMRHCAEMRDGEAAPHQP